MARTKQLAKLLATVAFGVALILTAPKDAEAFSCLFISCETVACTIPNIQDVCSDNPLPGCVSTGGSCTVDQAPCEGETKFICTGRQE
jgi:hypothetical protein